MKGDHRLKQLTRAQLIRLVRRLLVLASIFVYIVVSFQAAIRSYELSQGVESPLTTYNISTATLIGDYVGAATIRDSRLVKHTLVDDTTPRDGTLYLESLSTATFTGCSGANFDAELYGNTYLREMYAQLASRGAYNLTHLAEFELILPVVDCTFPPVVDSDQTHARVFYLLRSVQHPNAVYVLTASMAIQNYAIPMEHEEGACLVTTFTLVNDMRAAASVEHYFAVALGYPYDAPPPFDMYFHVGETSDSKWILQSVPRDPNQEQTKVIHTATARGIYLRATAIQSNIKHMVWSLEDDPAAALSEWTWRGRTTLRDNWAWVHYIHALFGLSTLFSLVTLFLVMYRNLQKGKIWIGDAFAQVSSTLVFRGTIVVVSTHFNEYWALTELCLAGGFDVAQLPPLLVFPEILHADLLTLFLCCIDFFGYATKTRIDPAFVIVVFEVVYYRRVLVANSILRGTIGDWFRAYSVKVHRQGFVTLDPILAQLAPLRLWTASPIPLSNLLYLTATSVAVFTLTWSFVVSFVVATKAYNRRHSTSLRAQVSASRPAVSNSRAAPDGSGTESPAEEPKRTFTQFELATGAELQNRFGVISDYDNFVYFKGLKFASADGIYSNGFVIANGKFLVATEDILAIILMKLVRRRLRNVYTYEVDGSKLKQTAQLVYPNTISWTDLLHPNVGVLA